MSPKSESYQRGIPTKPYDLLREGLVVFVLLAIVTFVLALAFGSPDYPTVRGEDVAKLQPIAYVKTATSLLAGNSGIQGYGPPYSPDTAHSQRILGIAPATWFGVTNPIDPRQDLVMQPLRRLAEVNSEVATALGDFQAADTSQQDTWTQAYLGALDRATVNDGQVQVPNGNYGPVPVLMNGMLQLGRAGLLEGALTSNAQLPFTLDFTPSLLFFQDTVDENVAKTLDMTGDAWGISHETGPFPGAWWLWPYTFFYQVPPMSSSPNADLQVVLIITVIFLITLFTPFVPIINQLPLRLRVYKLIWRDWYLRTTDQR